MTQVELESPLEKQLIDSINRGVVSYAESGGKLYFDFRFINVLRQLKSEESPLVVCASSYQDPDNAIAQSSINHFLSHLTFVDHTIAGQAPSDFTLRARDEAFLSNVHFISGAIGATTTERIRSRKSSYQALLEQTEIKEGKYVKPAF